MELEIKASNKEKFMRKYLIRSGFDIKKKNTIKDALYGRLIAGNSGNLMYAYGIMNVLTTEDSQVDSTFYKLEWSDGEIDMINSQYDAFILPLADAFRDDFVIYLDKYTEFIKKLKIPCIVIGVGLRAPIDVDLSVDFGFDNSVYEFVKAVLDHSEKLGLRGDITGAYLKKLGFCPERDFTSIGCPSLYMYGDTVHTRKIPETISKLAVAFSPLADSHVNEFIVKNIDLFEQSEVIIQTDPELAAYYYGRKFQYNDAGDNFNEDFMKKLIKSNQIRFFYNAKDWIDYMHKFDLCISDRFHGTVAAILAGIPHVMIPIDARTKELVEYHNITHIDNVDMGTNINDYIASLDFLSFEKNQHKNLEHYIKFLNCNGLKNVFAEHEVAEYGKSQMEVMFCSNYVSNVPDPFELVPRFEQNRRLIEYQVQRVRRGIRHRFGDNHITG